MPLRARRLGNLCSSWEEPARLRVWGATGVEEHPRHYADGVFYGVGDALTRQIGVSQTVGEIGNRAFAPRRLLPEALHGREGDGGLGKGILRGLGGNRPVPQVGRIAEAESERARRGGEPAPGLPDSPRRLDGVSPILASTRMGIGSTVVP